MNVRYNPGDLLMQSYTSTIAIVLGYEDAEFPSEVPGHWVIIHPFGKEFIPLWVSSWSLL